MHIAKEKKQVYKESLLCLCIYQGRQYSKTQSMGLVLKQYLKFKIMSKYCLISSKECATLIQGDN